VLVTASRLSRARRGFEAYHVVHRARQIDLFESGLDALSKMASSINKVVEIDANGKVTVFELPKIG
jgi:hypothetical protein